MRKEVQLIRSCRASPSSWKSTFSDAVIHTCDCDQFPDCAHAEARTYKKGDGLSTANRGIESTWVAQLFSLISASFRRAMQIISSEALPRLSMFNPHVPVTLLTRFIFSYLYYFVVYTLPPATRLRGLDFKTHFSIQSRLLALLAILCGAVEPLHAQGVKTYEKKMPGSPANLRVIATRLDKKVAISNSYTSSMIRRNFIKRGITSALATVRATSSIAASFKTQEKTFSLNYTPHDGTFVNQMGKMSFNGFKGMLGMEHGNEWPGKDGELALITAYREVDSFLKRQNNFIQHSIH